MSGTDALLLDTLRRIVGDAQVLTEGDLSGYELDWRKRHRGRSLAAPPKWPP
jgi:hypothetical protein